jgi:isopentenyl diphosphate isomerase/L-lactate dehydrogenase-like FMN-dependent dehydrogenase
MAGHLGADEDPGGAGGTAKPPTGGWAPLSWADVEWAAEASGLPVMVKGVLTAEDARLALGRGASAIVVSNHGARQLDGCVPTAVALVEVVEAVGGAVPVLVDGGIRNGADVVRALAMGADAVLVGRPYLWGLAAGGEEGVREVLGALVADTARTLVLMGAASPAEVARYHVRPRAWD